MVSAATMPAPANRPFKVPGASPFRVEGCQNNGAQAIASMPVHHQGQGADGTADASSATSPAIKADAKTGANARLATFGATELRIMRMRTVSTVVAAARKACAL